MIFSVTERIEWLRCRRSWNYGSFNRRGLAPIIPPLALNAGTIWHRAHEKWSAQGNIDFKNWIYIEGSSVLETIKANYKDKVGVNPDPEELQSISAAILLLGHMAEGYQNYWKSNIPKGFGKVDTEKTIIVTVPESDHSYEGTFDQLLIDRKGMLWVSDYKTFDRHPNFSDLLKTEQFLDYLWILHRAIEIGVIDAQGVGGMLYDGAWKRDNKPLDEMFTRRSLSRPQAEIDNHWVTISACINEMADDKFPEEKHHPVYNRYYTCTNCKFEYLCATHMRGENTEAVEKIKFTTREKQGFALTVHGENFG